MTVFTAIIYTPEGRAQYLASDGATLTACDACAMRFIDPVTAETAATRALGEGWAFEIEETEI